MGARTRFGPAVSFTKHYRVKEDAVTVSILGGSRRLLVVTTLGLALTSPASFAASEELQTTIGKASMYALILFAMAVAVTVYFMRLRDKRRAPLSRIFEEQEHLGIHLVKSDTLVTECVRKMAAEKIGALVVMEGEKLLGIFTERDALNKVLAGGVVPGGTKVSEVMTKDPYCVPPTTTVGEAMGLITKRRFRHLPVVENGSLVAVVSSGDLIHWLVGD
jgi:predicted transcriptional regulator